MVEVLLIGLWHTDTLYMARFHGCLPIYPNGFGSLDACASGQHPLSHGILILTGEPTGLVPGVCFIETIGICSWCFDKLDACVPMRAIVLP